MSKEKLEKLEREKYVVERKLTAGHAQGKTIAERTKAFDPKWANPPPLHSCRNVGNLFERANHSDR